MIKHPRAHGCWRFVKIFALVFLLGLLGVGYVYITNTEPFRSLFDLAARFGFIAFLIVFTVLATRHILATMPTWEFRRKIVVAGSLACIPLSFGAAILFPAWNWLVYIGCLPSIGLSVFGIMLTIMAPPGYYPALSSFNTGDYVRALELLDRSIREQPKRWESRQLRAGLYCERGEWQRAEHDARLALELKPNNEVTLEVLGCALLSQGAYENARQVLELGSQRLSKRGILEAMLGKSEYRLGNYQAAVRHFERALQRRLEPKQRYLTANYYLACALEKSGEARRAGEAFRTMTHHSHHLAAIKQSLEGKTDIESKLMQDEVSDIERRLTAF